jgi:hypothetical protein
VDSQDDLNFNCYCLLRIITLAIKNDLNLIGFLRNGVDMKPVSELQGFMKFIQAVERGKELHQGPFTIHELYSALMAEVTELVEAYELTLSAMADLGVSEYPMARVASEATDVAVVAYRFAEFLRLLDENRASRLDPR